MDIIHSPEFKALMWKHFIVRRRKFCELIFEMISPVAPIMAVVVLSNLVYDKYNRQQVEKLSENLYFRTNPNLISRASSSVAEKMYTETMKMVVGYTFFAGPLIVFAFLMTRLLDERASGIRELVKLCGASSTLINFTHFLNSMPGCLVFVIVTSLIVKIGERPLLPKVHFCLFFCGLMLHFFSLLAAAFFFTYISKKAEYSASLVLFVYIGLWLPVRLFNFAHSSTPVLFVIGLFPHAPAYWLLEELTVRDIEWDIYNIWESHVTYKNGSKCGAVGAAFIALAAQISIFAWGAWYLDKIRPGLYGVALPWYFIFPQCCVKELNSSKKVYVEENPGYDRSAYQRYFEKEPTGMDPGIRVESVTKEFSDMTRIHRALSDVSFNVYKGEITVLLGHNGAGKSTIISVITGLMNPTYGEVYINGVNTATGQKIVRSQLGLCPQHNLHYPDLNIIEHFVFFTMLKGQTYNEAFHQSKVLLQKLRLLARWYSMPHELSGGVLRRLQLGCALCGKAEVLILDEPTSGLDLQARREMWDILLSLRGSRTMLLTTHFMEEADVLADRIIALHAGRLHCHATPNFLKNAFGTGFRLTVKTIGPPNEQMMTTSIQRSVPGAKLLDITPNSLVYDLPVNRNLTKMFDKLELRKTSMKVQSLSVSISTSLEDVFMNLCCDVDIANLDENIIQTPPGEFESYTGHALRCYRFWTLFNRQLDFTTSRCISFLFLQVILPSLMMFALTQLFNDNRKASNFSFRSQIPDLEISEVFGENLTELIDEKENEPLSILETFNISSNLLNNDTLINHYKEKFVALIKNESLFSYFLNDVLRTRNGTCADKKRKIRLTSESVNDTEEFLSSTVETSNDVIMKVDDRKLSSTKWNEIRHFISNLKNMKNEITNVYNSKNRRIRSAGADDDDTKELMSSNVDTSNDVIMKVNDRESSSAKWNEIRHILSNLENEMNNINNSINLDDIDVLKFYHGQKDITNKPISDIKNVFKALNVLKEKSKEVPNVMDINVDKKDQNIFNHETGIKVDRWNISQDFNIPEDDTVILTTPADNNIKTTKNANNKRNVTRISLNITDNSSVDLKTAMNHLNVTQNDVANTLDILNALKITSNDTVDLDTLKILDTLDITKNNTIDLYSAIDALKNTNVTTVKKSLRRAYVKNMQDNVETFLSSIIREEAAEKKTKSVMNSTLFAIFNVFIIITAALNNTALPTRERITIVRHIHLMTGCSPIMYWSVTFVYHMIFYIMFSVAAAVYAVTSYEKDQTLNNYSFNSAYFFVLIFGGMAFHSFAYFVTFFFNEHKVSMFLMMLQIVYGLLCPIMSVSLEELISNKSSNYYLYLYTLEISGAFLPAHTLVNAVLKLTKVARLDRFCAINMKFCPSIPKPYPIKKFDREFCCSQGLSKKGRLYSYFSFAYGAGYYFMLLIFQFAFYAILVIALQNGVFDRWYTKYIKKSLDTTPHRFKTESVDRERLYVDGAYDKLMQNPDNPPPVDQMLIRNITVIYPKSLYTTYLGLNDISFSVKKGECLGILGVSGAGKTTIFRAISAEKQHMTGEIYVQNRGKGQPGKQYVRSIGYCPQFDGVDYFRTGHENISTLLALRGLKCSDIDRESRQWLASVGMTKYAYKIVSSYSGGMVRRLVAADSLCAGTPVSILDEPTSGVDTAARRLVWAAMKRGLLNDRAIVFTSHGADELELLSTRIMFIGAGEVMVMGTPASLRSEYAPGNTVGLKFNMARAHTPQGKEEIVKVKVTMNKMFDCTLKEAHMTALVYRINKKITYNRTFTILENIKREYHGLLEAYTVSNTDLEDVFFNFKEQYMKNFTDQRKASSESEISTTNKKLTRTDPMELKMNKSEDQRRSF